MSKIRLAILIVGLAALLPASIDAATTFGDIVITVRSEPKGQATHGYAEYVFTVTNRSTERGHQVTLVLPQDASGPRYMDSIRSVSRTVQVEPQTTLQVALLHPDYPLIMGNGLKVIIDGREQEGGVPVSLASSSRMWHWGRRGRYVHKSSSSGEALLILVSQRVGEKFELVDRTAVKVGPSGRPGGRPGGPAGAPVIIGPGAPPAPGFPMPGAPPGSPGTVVTYGQPVRSEEQVSSWSPRWLSYSRYDGIVLTREELEGLSRGPAESQAVRTALFQYVEAGGTLLVLDPGPLSLPRSWKRSPATGNGLQSFQGGFGLCLQIDNRDTSKWPSSTWAEVARAWQGTAGPFQSQRTLTDANAGLPIIEDIGLPVRGLFVLMLLFTLAIGPGNLWLLARWKRRIWLLWTAPALSLLTCTLVFGYMILAEGWQGRTRLTGFTLLDETEQRATTLGRCAAYSPLTPGDGLHFSQDTEVTLQGVDSAGGSFLVCDIDLTRDQHLRRGWVSARVPAHFQLRRSEVKRLERLVVSQDAEGSFQATNQLGAAIRSLLLADENGKLYSTGMIPVGQSAVLPPVGKSLPVKSSIACRQLFGTAEWANLGPSATRPAEAFLAPRTYLAVLESSPFLEPSLAGAMVRPTDSYVLGLMAAE